jgi:hypothetical protein
MDLAFVREAAPMRRTFALRFACLLTQAATADAHEKDL